MQDLIAGKTCCVVAGRSCCRVASCCRYPCVPLCYNDFPVIILCRYSSSLRDFLSQAAESFSQTWYWPRFFLWQLWYGQVLLLAVYFARILNPEKFGLLPADHRGSTAPPPKIVIWQVRHCAQLEEGFAYARIAHKTTVAGSMFANSFQQLGIEGLSQMILSIAELRSVKEFPLVSLTAFSPLRPFI